jgi:hypothetical protein
VGLSKLRNHSEINGSGFAARGESLPCPSRVAHISDFQGPREIVSASARDDQDGNFQLYEFGQMPMDGTVPAKDDGDIGLLNERRPLSASQALKGGKRFCDTPRPQNCSGAHALELNHMRLLSA